MKSYYAMFFCLAITLHNIEEALWLPEWSQQGQVFQKSVAPGEFYFAVIIITAFAYLSSFLFLYFPKSNFARRLFIGFVGAMIINAIFPHLLATILMKSYAPGLLTALLLNVPINLFILYHLNKDCITSKKELIISTIGMSVVLLACIPILLVLGAKLTA
ncbi:HXXEE domain-containing protein [Lysinibacillus sp. 54212]|uniref:HXXEE domain-containing protein n=1 Tax=Lysinibacillus sp. 54212 TaxID=3119829 RepID=UPI002FC69B94